MATVDRGDARTFDPGTVDAIVTNPPLGSRVHVDAAALLIECLPNFAKALARGGRLVWITPVPKKTSPVAEALGFLRDQRCSVDLGGVHGQVERWLRP
jgi:tRNA G10  N-methylase Trm11